MSENILFMFEKWKGTLYNCISDRTTFEDNQHIIKDGVELGISISYLLKKNEDLTRDNFRLRAGTDESGLSRIINFFLRNMGDCNVDKLRGEEYRSGTRSELKEHDILFNEYIEIFKERFGIDIYSQSPLFEKTFCRVFDSIYSSFNEIYSNKDTINRLLSKNTELSSKKQSLEHTLEIANTKLSNLEKEMISSGSYKVVRNSKEYKKFKQSVLKRDGVCQCCGSKDELEVHHPMPFNQYNSIGADTNNGITLCKECHAEYHSKYGYKRNANAITLALFLRDYGMNLQTSLENNSDFKLDEIEIQRKTTVQSQTN